jgi:hypothetical protein
VALAALKQVLMMENVVVQPLQKRVILHLLVARWLAGLNLIGPASSLWMKGA